MIASGLERSQNSTRAIPVNCNSPLVPPSFVVTTRPPGPSTIIGWFTVMPRQESSVNVCVLVQVTGALTRMSPAALPGLQGDVRVRQHVLQVGHVEVRACRGRAADPSGTTHPRRRMRRHTQQSLRWRAKQRRQTKCQSANTTINGHAGFPMCANSIIARTRQWHNRATNAVTRLSRSRRSRQADEARACAA